jgi:hypothetical protein
MVENGAKEQGESSLIVDPTLVTLPCLAQIYSVVDGPK